MTARTSSVPAGLTLIVLKHLLTFFSVTSKSTHRNPRIDLSRCQALYVEAARRHHAMDLRLPFDATFPSSPFATIAI